MVTVVDNDDYLKTVRLTFSDGSSATVQIDLPSLRRLNEGGEFCLKS